MKFSIAKDETIEVRASRVKCAVEGTYPVKIASTREAVSMAGNEKLEMTLTITSGPQKGAVIYTYLLSPMADKENLREMARSQWLSFLMSLGQSEKRARKILEDLDTDTLGLVGREGTVYYKPKDEEAGKKFDTLYWRVVRKAPAAPIIEADASPQGDALAAFLGGDDVDDEIPF